MSEGVSDGVSEGVSSGLTPCRQLMPSSGREHGNASSNQKFFIEARTVTDND